LRLPLLTKRERRNLNGFWFYAVTHDFMRRDFGSREQIKISLAVVDILDEFADAIEWIEEMKA
jgi:hypothetical protein